MRAGRGLLAAATLLALLPLIACSAPAGPTAQSPTSQEQQPGAQKRVVAAIGGDPLTLSDTLNSATPGGAAGVQELDLLVHAGLSMVDDHGNRMPRLAQSVPSLDNGLWVLQPDGRMQTIYKLKTGAKWHDGVPLTSDDLVFTVTVGKDKQEPSFDAAGFAYIDSVQATDPQTVVINWTGPFIDADAMFADRFAVPLPKHILEAPYLANKADLTSLPYWTTDFVGAGPFKVGSFTSGSRVVLEANADYVLGRPHIDELEVKFIPDPNSLLANALAGTIELTLGRGLSVEQANQMTTQWTDGKVDVAIQNVVEMLPQFINPDPPAVANAAFRRGLLQASDRQLLVDTLMLGKSSIAHSTMVVSTQKEYPYVESQVVRYNYDPRSAASALAGAGYSSGPGGNLVDGSGQPLTLEVRASTSDEIPVKIALALKDQWQTLGIGTNVVPIPAAAARDRQYRVTKPAFEIVMQRPLLQHYLSTGVPTAANDYVGDNPTRYSSLELDALINRYNVTIPWDARMDAFGQIVHQLSSEVVDMGIFYGAQPALIGNRLVNASAAKSVPPANQVWNAHEWDVR